MNFIHHMILKTNNEYIYLYLYYTGYSHQVGRDSVVSVPKYVENMLTPGVYILVYVKLII
jgi:hypothetical protein